MVIMVTGLGSLGSGTGRSRNATPMSDFDALRALLALARHDTLSAAARALGAPKSTLSRRLAALEEGLGQRLTRPDGGRLTLTEAGRRYAYYSERILALAEEGRREVQAISCEMAGEVRVWISHGMTRGWTTRMLNEVLTCHPGLTLDVRVLPSGALPDETGTDLWISCDARSAPSLRRLPLGRWRRRLYTSAAPDCACRGLADPSTVEQCPWIGLASEPPEVVLHHSGSRQAHRLRPRARLRVDSIEMLADGIARGYGIGILPSWLAECPRHGLHGSYARVLADWEGSPVELSLHVPHGPRPRRTDVLIEYLRANLPRRWTFTDTTG
ncbi:hypothetical protein CKO22_12165 [Thiococcus pfennigii]|nr:hypothetical protein [Thiococcus pfennigii]